MKQRQSHPRRGHLPCDSLGTDDGIDSRDLFRNRSRKKSHHKAHQLCRQVMETINYLLAGDLGDSRLHQVMVDSVTPAPDASRLLVSIRLMDLHPDFDLTAIQSALQGASGLIRCEVASVVQRKKAPELVFLVTPEGSVPHE
jgi:ribosome-binding factor A